MATILNRTTTFATNGTVTAAGLHNLIDDTAIYSGLITTQTNLASVGTGDKLLIAQASGGDTTSPFSTTVLNLFDDALTGGTYTNANIAEQLTYGTATGNRTISTSATITTGTIPNLTAGTTTSTAATITNGTITSGTITTALIPTLTAGTTTGTAGIFTSGTVATLNSTTGTIATLNSTTGTITNLSTTLAGDFTISQGTGTLGTTAVTAGSYGSVSAIPFITVDAKGRITSATTGTFSTTPADGSITPAKLSQPLTLATAVASTSGTAIDFTSIPSWAKRVTVMLNGVSVSGTSLIEVRIGTTSGIEATGYKSASGWGGGGGAYGVSTTGFIPYGATIAASAANLLHGSMIISTLGSNRWVEQCGFYQEGGSDIQSSGGGSKTLTGGVLDRVRITTVGGTDTFDAGSINIMYEG